MKGGKMSKNNSWLIWLVAIVAVVALIVAVITIAKVNMTGQGIFEWFKKESSQTQQQFQIAESRGILADAYLSIGGDENFLKGYEVKYDSDGNLVYEIKGSLNSLLINSEFGGNSINYPQITNFEKFKEDFTNAENSNNGDEMTRLAVFGIEQGYFTREIGEIAPCEGNTCEEDPNSDSSHWSNKKYCGCIDPGYGESCKWNDQGHCVNVGANSCSEGCTVINFNWWPW